MSELKVERKENMCGGEGHILIKHILGEKWKMRIICRSDDRTRMFSWIS